MKKIISLSSLAGLVAASALVMTPTVAQAAPASTAVNIKCQAALGVVTTGEVVSTQKTPIAGSYNLVTQIVDYNGQECYALTGEGSLPAAFSKRSNEFYVEITGVKNGKRVALVSEGCTETTYDDGTKSYCPVLSPTVAWGWGLPTIQGFSDLRLTNTYTLKGEPSATVIKKAKKTRTTKVKAAKKVAKKKIVKIKKSKAKAKVKKAKITKVNKAKNLKIKKAKTAYKKSIKGKTVTKKIVTNL